MNTKIIFAAIFFLLCVNLISCSQSKTKQVEANTDTTTVLAQSEPSNSLIDEMVARGKIQLDKMGIDTTTLKDMTDEQFEAVIETIANYADTTNNKSLNDIRFGNWTEKDWYDNDYFRFLRKCVDDCLNGVDNENTKPFKNYKSDMKGKFFIANVEPYFGGGLFITLVFLDKPEIAYRTVVYSDVDKEIEKITGYRLFGFQKLDEPTDMTKEETLQIIKEHPENKLW